MEKLRNFQERTRDNLIEGKSTIVVAPTGLGKTLAAILPFKNPSGNAKLGCRIIYVLPIRALARSVRDEFKNLGTKAVVHHGDEPESKWFTEKAIITTVDQYFTAFAGAPLSWSSTMSHAVSGATLVSYTVFDEVHLLNPKNGLQLLFAILKLRKRWGLPTTVMTATLPDSVVKFLETICGLERVEASEKDVKERDSWRNVEIKLHDTELNVDELAVFVKECWKNHNKIIVFVNTVERAISLYKKLQGDATFRDKILLAHSRFSKKDRERIEDEIHTKFGKNSSFEGILVTTQVAEAGLNISAPLIITELAPMDSLIQRAGRCARFKENLSKVRGEVIVVKPKVENSQWYTPYFDKVFLKKRGKEKRDVTISELTFAVLRSEFNKNEEILLNWSKEKELVNLCLNAVYRSFIEGKESIEMEDLRNSKLLEDNKLYDILNESKEILLGG